MERLDSRQRRLHPDGFQAHRRASELLVLRSFRDAGLVIEIDETTDSEDHVEEGEVMRAIVLYRCAVLSLNRLAIDEGQHFFVDLLWSDAPEQPSRMFDI